MRKRDIFHYAALCFTLLLLLIPDICRGLDPTAPVPKSGQTQCWDTPGNLIDCAGTGQDGDYQAGVAWPSPRFTDNGDGTATDNLTSLMWLQDANLPGGQLNWYDAIDFCESLNLGDVGDAWRLPNKNEIHSLMSFGTYDPVLPSGHPFINVQTDFYWSSTNMQDDGTRAWALDLGFGHVWYWYIVKADPHSALCVSKGESVSTEDAPAPVPKTGQTYCTDLLGNLTSCAGTGQDGEYQMGVADPDPRFTDNGDGTVTDNLTGLIWTKDTNIAGESMLWQEALYFCEDLSLGACGDNWRLPNMMETRSLSDYDFLLPSLPSGHPFTNVVMPMYYWTSSTVVDLPSQAYTENVGWGLEDYFVYKINDVYTALAPTAWCVSNSDACTADILKIGDQWANCGDVGVKIPICLVNLEHEVGAVQVDLCENVNDCLICVGCEMTERTTIFDCMVNELENGCCAVVVFSKNPGGVINPGECDIVVIDYTLKDELECCSTCIKIDGENIEVVDQYGYLVDTGVGKTGMICPFECGDVEPAASTAANWDCGDGDVDIFDILEEVDFIIHVKTPDDCQAVRADVPTGTPPNCDPPDGTIDVGDLMVIIDMALNRQDCCSYYYGGVIY